MALSDVLARFKYELPKFGTVQQVTDAVTEIYSSTMGAALLEEFLSYNRDVEIVESNFNGASHNNFEIYYSKEEIDNVKFINSFGYTFDATVTRTILHELIHIIKDWRDLAPEVLAGDYTIINADYTYKVVDLANQIMSDLNYSNDVSRLSYTGAFLESNPNHIQNWGKIDNFTYGSEIDTAIVIPGNVAIVDTGQNGTRDLILGNQNSETIVTGDQDDFVYAGKGDDRITGGAGEDHLEGNDGDGILMDGAGNRSNRSRVVIKL